MARTRVEEYTRQLASGTRIKVHGHERRYQAGGAAVPAARRTPVMTHQREQARERNRLRRQEAKRRASVAARKGWTGIKRRGRQTKKMLTRGGRRMRRAGRYLATKRRTLAVVCVVGGLAEVGAGLLWSTAGLIVTTVSILVALISGGLLLGGAPSEGPTHAKDNSRAAVRAARARQRDAHRATS
jgi:hypothetical protein